MKILMTGMSARSVGSKKIRYDFIALSDIIENALVELGHEVDRRVVPTGDAITDLLGYDHALVLVNWVSSLSSMHAHEAGLTLDKLDVLGIPTTLYIDDWRTAHLGDDLAHHVGKDKGWKHHTENFRHFEYARMSEGQVERTRLAFLRIIGPECPWPILAPFHGWGDHESFLRVSKTPINARLITIDPSPMVVTPDVDMTPTQDRNWVLATLQNHDSWLKKLGNTWPVLQYGGVKKGGGGIRAGGPDKVVPEREVIQAYANNRGMLVAPYASEGTGWWRPRYTFATNVGSVVHCGSDIDAELIGPSFTNPLEDVETASDRELDDLAERQFNDFERWSMTKQQFYDTLEGVVRGG